MRGIKKARVLLLFVHGWWWNAFFLLLVPLSFLQRSEGKLYVSTTLLRRKHARMKRTTVFVVSSGAGRDCDTLAQTSGRASLEVAGLHEPTYRYLMTENT